MVLGAALLLVVAVGKVLTGLGNGQDPGNQASNASSTTSQGPSQPYGPVPVALPSGAMSGAALTPSAPAPLAEPGGPCLNDQISVTPSVPAGEGGHKVTIELALSGVAPACTFEVSAKTLGVKVASGSGSDATSVWSSQDCPASVPAGQVVVRSGQPTVVPVVWNGQQTSANCQGSAWAMPGTYEVMAAVFGSNPTQSQFQLVYPQAGVVTKTATPKPAPTGDPTPSAAVAPQQTSPAPVPQSTAPGKTTRHKNRPPRR